jgi:hypothetical protein
MGLYSKPFISRMEPSVKQFVEQVNAYRSAAAPDLPDGFEVTLPSPPASEPAPDGETANHTGSNDAETADDEVTVGGGTQR